MNTIDYFSHVTSPRAESKFERKFTRYRVCHRDNVEMLVMPAFGQRSGARARAGDPGRANSPARYERKLHDCYDLATWG